jgi:4-amino-4-deoxy-L-arabinose transferase-like glycosyltransferase
VSGNWRWSSPLWTGVRQRLGTPAAGHALCLLAILGLAAACRFAALSTFPPGLNPDEAMNGNDALASLSSGHFEVFYPENYGREGLFIWLVALSLKLFGASIPALRYPSAVLGTLGVAAVYLLASELYGRRIAVLSGLLTAVSFWQLGFSRMSLRGILVPLFTSLAFGVLLRGLRKKSARSVLLAGALFGLGVYTYIAFRAAPGPAGPVDGDGRAAGPASAGRPLVAARRLPCRDRRCRAPAARRLSP